MWRESEIPGMMSTLFMDLPCNMPSALHFPPIVYFMHWTPTLRDPLAPPARKNPGYEVGYTFCPFTILSVQGQKSASTNVQSHHENQWHYCLPQYSVNMTFWISPRITRLSSAGARRSSPLALCLVVDGA